MALEYNFGFRPVTEPKGSQVVEYTAGGTVYKHGLVTLATDGDVEARADSSTTTNVQGVALNYAVSGEKVLVCVDPDMLYVTTYNIAPNAVKADFGQFLNSAGNAAAKDAMNAHISAGRIVTAAATYTHLTSVAKLIGVAPIKGNPFGDGSGSGAVNNLVYVRILSFNDTTATT